jgi:hypothetical protein
VFVDDLLEVRFPGLRGLDRHELQESLPADSLRLTEATPPGRIGTSYEPLTTVAIVLLSAAALRGITAWLLKKRHRGRVEYDVAVRRPDGSTEHRRLVIEFSESSTDEAVVRALGEQLGAAETVISEAVSSAL